MRIPVSTRNLGLLIAGAAGIAGASCKSSNDAPRLQTASAANAPAQQPVTVPDTQVPDTQVPNSSRMAETPKPETRAVKPARKKPVTEAAARAPKPVPPAPDSAAATSPDGQDKTLSYDAGTNTVTFELIGGPHGFQFNGYAVGGATLTVPSKANVVMNFINKDGTPHSAEIISGEGPLPNAGIDPAIPRAYTNQLLQGLPQEGTDVMRFQVPERGSYRIFCGVPGHGVSMWIWMKVDPAAKTPTFGPTKA